MLLRLTRSLREKSFSWIHKASFSWCRSEYNWFYHYDLSFRFLSCEQKWLHRLPSWTQQIGSISYRLHLILVCPHAQLVQHCISFLCQTRLFLFLVGIVVVSEGTWRRWWWTCSDSIWKWRFNFRTVRHNWSTFCLLNIKYYIKGPILYPFLNSDLQRSFAQLILQ